MADLAGPRGPKPRRVFSVPNVVLYGTLLLVAAFYALPLYVMIVTSLKTMPEIRLGNVFSPPVEITFQPWVKAWSTACTGINCDGLSRGFRNSVMILIPSVILSIAISSVNGYALANWKYRGSEFFFAVLMIGAFIPYQVMLYPIVLVLKNLGDGITALSNAMGMGDVRVYGTLSGLVIVHTIFGMPILTLLFRNYFSSLPEELF